MKDGLYAKFHTSKGEILVNLEFEKTPMTVGNFVGLAEGKFENTASDKGVPYYDGMKFHRVIENFMIQGGCPLGTGTGSPKAKGVTSFMYQGQSVNYPFKDEFHNGHVLDKPGVLAMANAGPNTNGSQFFITHKETKWLNNKHTVFGEIVSQADQDVVNAIVKGDTINAIVIL